MSIQLRVTALKMLMVGRAKDQFEIWEQDVPRVMDDDAVEDKAWNELLGKVQDYATRRRLEANQMKGKGNNMDVDGVDQEEEEEDWPWDNSWPQGGEEWPWGNGGDVDALGKVLQLW